MAFLAAALVFLATRADAAGPVGLALTGADYGNFANATALKAALLENYDLTQPPPRANSTRGVVVRVHLLQYEAASTIRRSNFRNAL